MTLLRPVLHLTLLLLALAGCASPRSARPTAEAPASPPSRMSLTEELALREGWIAQRHAQLLPMMRRHGVSMWIVVTEEFHEDPMIPVMVTPRPLAGNRDLFVFVDAGDAGLVAYALTAYTEENLRKLFQTPFEPTRRDWQKAALAKVVEDHAPQTIAIAHQGLRGHDRSLTHASYQFLREVLGDEAQKKFIPAAPLIEEVADTRLESEKEHYRRLVQLTSDIVQKLFSDATITPGKTTIGDVRRALFDEVGRQGFGLWFQPDLRLQRAGVPNPMSRGFLAVALEDQVIQRGDLLHVDFGIVGLGLSTDFQRMAYVLREGETEPPAGLTAALANTHALQDAMMSAALPGKSSAAVYEEAMAAMKARGIEAMLYSHPLGFHGHALGPAIDFRAAAQRDSPRPLRSGSYVAVELNTQTAVPEWNGQKVYMMEEDPAHLTEQGFQFFVPRQERLILIGAPRG